MTDLGLGTIGLCLSLFQLGVLFHQTATMSCTDDTDDTDTDEGTYQNLHHKRFVVKHVPASGLIN